MTKKGLDKMVYDTNNIDLTKLKQYKRDINSEYNSFKNKTYNTFSLSYVNNSNNAYIKKMVVTLEKLYKSIDKSYLHLINYLDSYVENTVSLESALSNNSSINLIQESTIKNFVNNKLSNLPNEKNIKEGR